MAVAILAFCQVMRLAQIARLGLLRSRWARALALLSLSLGLGLCSAARFIEGRAAPFVTGNAEQLPRLKVGLLLGCSERLSDGRSNLFFEKRIAAAARLFQAGKVDYLLVSGDNSHPGYDEPSDMRRALLARGVPGSRIVLDYAGFRTLDSVVRAKEVFGLQRFTVISQRFHDLRAVYLARAHGVEAYGYAAADVGGADGIRVRLRELFSRTFALFELNSPAWIRRGWGPAATKTAGPPESGLSPDFTR